MSNKFNPMKARMRASFSSEATLEPRFSAVDKEALKLSDVQITLEGEAKGHGVWLDRAFCESVAAAGNETGDAGVKVRFGHPGMCSDALGTYLGRAKNFRVVDVTRKESGEKAAGVIADVELDKNADRTEWILNMSESAPDSFGMSIVFTYSDLKSTNADGEPILASSYENASDFFTDAGENKIFAVLGKLHGSDFTDTPAATDGVFSQDSLAAEAEEMLGEHPEISEAILGKPEKVVEFLDRMGLLKALETTRISGLQAAKDKKIAELQGEVEKYSVALAAEKENVELANKALEPLQLEVASLKDELDAIRAENENLKAEVTAKTGALDQAAADIKQLESKCGEAEKALSETKAALEVEITRYREQVGSAMQLSATAKVDDSWTARYRQAVKRA